jgi:sulfate adenylyltransferase subunit 1 (EFTu-like GTPase family)
VQSRRHARIARLLGITSFVLAINKMDLVDFDRGVFDGICDDFDELLRGATLHPIPLSALHGDNVITRSDRTPWFDGPPLLEYLETVRVDRDVTRKPFRFPVQLVSRPSHDFRGYAGQIVSGTIRRGEAVTAWPSGRTSRVARITTWDGDLESAFAPMSVTIVLEHELDISRGDLLSAGDVDVEVGQRFEADIVWMDEKPLDPAHVYLAKHTTRTVGVEIDHGLVMNQIGRATVTAARPLMFDRYADNRATGSFILIDPATNFTAGAGMIVNPVRQHITAGARPTAAARIARLARGAATEEEAADLVRRALEEILS